MKRENFGSKIGIVLAAAGSAVGLGNIWRFPYMTGQDGGAVFIAVYLFCVFVLGIPAMMAEFIVGRRGGANAPRAFHNLGKGGWSVIGFLGLIVSTIICGFYSVIAGWCLQYLFATTVGELTGDAAYVADYFATFSSDPLKPTIWTVIFILLTFAVVMKGIRKGIERAAKLMMPILFVLLIVLVVASCSLSGAWQGVEFLFKPDFSKVTGNMFLDALGQAFFSLSLGSMVLCTYASYFGRQVNITRSAAQIVIIDAIVAILAGLMIFPAAFSVGINPDSGPKLIFITLPVVFGKAFGALPAVAYIVGILFYALLTLAALTSTISMLEIGTSTLSEETQLSRSKAGAVVTAVAIGIGIVCSLSCGAVEGLELFGRSALDFCDFLTGQIMLPLNSLLTCIFVGWFVGKKVVGEELTNYGTLQHRSLPLYMFCLRVVCPLCIIAIFLHQLGMF